MKLELKHLAPYLPYGLKSVDYFNGTQLIRNVTIFNVANFFDQTTNAKPILRPLSGLTKPITHNGETFVPIEEYKGRYLGDRLDECVNASHSDLKYAQWHVIEQLLEWHFDIFNLIPQGLAIDINTLNS